LSCRVPYRIDISCPPDDALEQLVQLGALDIEPVDGGLAAIIPDGVTPDAVAGALGGANLTVSAAVARDDGSVWLLSPRTWRVASRWPGHRRRCSEDRGPPCAPEQPGGPAAIRAWWTRCS